MDNTYYTTNKIKDVFKNIDEKEKIVKKYEYIANKLSPMTESDQLVGFPSQCTNCSNNPKNGGSGICHCVLASNTIY